ncbi:hypothetical protein niasHT_005814 [Heterodera trifolii]|uniref:C2H2-type domain-containing protein n=1 Tax=Heterodera trifolii TaxID=157864 RepID=A0ABD2LWG3_9BILA
MFFSNIGTGADLPYQRNRVWAASTCTQSSNSKCVHEGCPLKDSSSTLLVHTTQRSHTQLCKRRCSKTCGTVFYRIIFHSTIRLLTIPSAASPSAFTSSISPPVASSVLFHNSSVRRWPVAIPAQGEQKQQEGPFSHLSVVDSFRIVRSQKGGGHLSAGTADRVTPPPFGGSKIGTLEMAVSADASAGACVFIFGAKLSSQFRHFIIIINIIDIIIFQSRVFSYCIIAICVSSHWSVRGVHVPWCVCRRARVAASPRASLAALLFLIGDCPEHSLVLQSSAFPPSVQSLYIFRVRQLIIRSIPPSLRHLNILHSSVTIANSDAFADANLFQLAVDGSDLVGPMPKGGKLRIGTGRLGQIRLNGVNDRWREVIKELVDQQEEAGGTDQQKKWREKDASGGVMVMQRRRVQQQRERKQKEEEEERETKQKY